MFKIVVSGGRDRYDLKWSVYENLNVYKEERNLVIIQGGAEGIDKAAYEWAKDNEIPCVTHWAKWKTQGSVAGPIRNQKMLEYWEPDIVMVFPGGKGTANMLKEADRQRYEIIRILEGGEPSLFREDEL